MWLGNQVSKPTFFILNFFNGHIFLFIIFLFSRLRLSTDRNYGLGTKPQNPYLTLIIKKNE